MISILIDVEICAGVDTVVIVAYGVERTKQVGSPWLAG